MNVIEYVVNFFVYMLLFNAMIFIPSGILLVILSSLYTAMTGDKIGNEVAYPLYILSFLSVWLSHKAASYKTYSNSSFFDALSNSITEFKTILLLTFPFLNRSSKDEK